MCIVHDLPEARIGDLNYVHKRYVTPDEAGAVNDMTAEIPFGASLTALIEEFNAGQTLESKLAHDADQIAFILDLKALSDIGYTPPQKWMPSILKRLKTEIGKSLARTILDTDSDGWWLKKPVN
jgi:putative hydrolase of HD superfamily